MRIANLHVSNFLGATAVDVATPQPVQLFAGRNGAGKSSLRDAIALALTADLGRVGLKKEAPALITDGADLAVCRIVDADGDEYQVSLSRSGKIIDSRGGRDSDPILPYVIDAQRFARLPHAERRAFLLGLMGIKTEPAEIRRRLIDRLFHKVACKDHELARIERIVPLLRAGFDPASKEAKAQATQAKGAWRTVTGEAYGSEKAKTWRATIPPYDAKIGAGLATELQHCDVAVEQWQQQVGKLQAEEQRRAGLRAKLPALLDQAGNMARVSDKLARDQATLAEYEQALKDLKAKAGAGPRVGLVHDLATAVAYLLSFIALDTPPSAGDTQAQAALEAYEREHGAVGDTGGDADAQARLPEVQRSRDLMASAVNNDRRDLSAAQQAKATADAMAAELAEVFDAAALADARHQADTLKLQRVAIVEKIDAQKSIKALVDGAAKKTKEATAHAADVTAWDAIGDALAPDGIPAEILAEALDPLNARLASSAVDTDWPLVVVTADMAVTYGGRDHRLLSESERWRADAMVAEAIAHLSGARLLVLDRFDVLDAAGRQDLLSWLDELAEVGEIDTALLFGTLKAVPVGLPETIAAHWLENGVCCQLKEAA